MASVVSQCGSGWLHKVTVASSITNWSPSRCDGLYATLGEAIEAAKAEVNWLKA